MNSIELLSTIQAYLERRITLADLEGWLSLRLPLFMMTPDSNAARLANLVMLGLAEIDAGLRTERSLRQRLKRAMPAGSLYFAAYGPATVPFFAISASRVVEAVIGVVAWVGIVHPAEAAPLLIADTARQGVNA